MRFILLSSLVLAPALASAAPMLLDQQGRILDGVGQPLNQTTTLTFTLRDGGGTARYTDDFTNVSVVDGYYAVQLGSGDVLDTSVFLDHGAMTLEVDVGGSVLSSLPLGGYPVVVAQQSLLATEASLQSLVTSIATTGLYSETCSDFATRGWASESDCLHDGRWHRVYASNPTLGSTTALREHVSAGADVRVVTNVNPTAWECQGISFMDRNWGDSTSKVVCHSGGTSHPGPHNQTTSGSYRSHYDLWSDGRIYTTQSTGTGGLSTGTWFSSGVVGKWYIRY